MAFAILSKSRVRDGEQAGDRGRKKSAENSGERWEERHGRWRLEQDDRDIALCFLSGQMIYRVSPCTSPRATAPQKHVRGCKNHQKRRRQRRLREGSWRGGKGGGRGENGERATELHDMGGITYLWASGPGTGANFRQISVGNNVRIIGT